MVQFPDKCEWQNGITQTTKRAWSGTQLGPSIIDTGAGVYRWGSIRGHVSLGLHTMVFQAEIYAIKAFLTQNTLKGYKVKKIYILSHSQADIKALDSFQMNSKWVWDCHQSLVQLAEHNRIQLVWVPGHMGIDGNKIARQGSSHLLIGPEPALGIAAKVAGRRNCTSRKHEGHWVHTWTTAS